jgi:hypothetical protein
MAETEVVGLLQLDPAVLVTDANVRFGLKQWRIDSLAEDIMEKGGVMTPIEVEPLAEPKDGKTHKVTMGHYRTAAVEKLNKDGAGLKLPATLKVNANPLERLKRQLSENLDRENLSPMDAARAMKELMDLGESRINIRTMFSRQSGKSGKFQPLSNAQLNINLGFLNFPKKIQTDIHNGIISPGGAYELSKVSKDKWEGIVAKCKQELEDEAEQAQKDEEKFLAGEKKTEERLQKQKDLEASVEAARVAQEAAIAEMKARGVAVTEAFKAAQDAKTAADEAVKKAAEDELKAKSTAAAEAETIANDAKKALAKLEAKLKEAADKLKERADKLAANKKAAAKKGAPAKAIKAETVKKVVATDAAGHVAPKSQVVHKSITELATLPCPYPKVKAIGGAFLRFLDGITTDSQMVTELGKITGEIKVDAKAKLADLPIAPPQQATA